MLYYYIIYNVTMYIISVLTSEAQQLHVRERITSHGADQGGVREHEILAPNLTQAPYSTVEGYQALGEDVQHLHVVECLLLSRTEP